MLNVEPGLVEPVGWVVVNRGMKEGSSDCVVARIDASLESEDGLGGSVARALVHSARIAIFLLLAGRDGLPTKPVVVVSCSSVLFPVKAAGRREELWCDDEDKSLVLCCCCGALLPFSLGGDKADADFGFSPDVDDFLDFFFLEGSWCSVAPSADFV